MFNGIFRDKKVLLTGNTGFKGSWLAIWLLELGSEVYGYALPPRTDRDNYLITGLASKIHHKNGDVRNLEALKTYFQEVRPDFAFHLAAQPLVLESYKNPHATFETNIIGTVNFFEAVRNTDSVEVAINITSDKCYKNQEWIWGYRETDPMGGSDPYSASKGCSEIITDAYLKSFFLDNASCKVASVRAGNVIGGGDWAENRIVPDFFRSIIENKPLVIRNPYAVRPWQHVLEPLSGYLALCQKLYEEGNKYSGGWNFGPASEGNYSVLDLIRKIQSLLGIGDVTFDNNIQKPYETNFLSLDISKAINHLSWRPVLNFTETAQFTVDAYRADLKMEGNYQQRASQILKYVSKALECNIGWAAKNEN